VGCVVVPVNTMVTRAEVEYVLGDAGCSLAIAWHALGPAVAEAAAALKVPFWTLSPGASVTGATPADVVDRDRDETAAILYTSGTTGRPKGCVHTHRSVMFTAVAAPAWANWLAPDAVTLASLPFFHVTGMQSVMNGSIFCGHTLVILPRWDRDAAARLIARYRVTSWINISTMVVDFLANPSLAEHDLSSLRVVSGGGAAMPAAVAQRVRDLTGIDYMEGYGLSETMAPTHINPLVRAKKHCLGIPIYDVDARVIDPDMRQELPQGQTGEIVIHGPQVLREYWNDPQKTAESFLELDGQRFFRTGDLGYVDEEGYFFFTDRLKRMINCSGMKVWPAEVEALLYGHPAIAECCVISVPDAYRGETVKALVVLKPGARADADEITAWCKDKMASYKIPRQLRFVDALPRSPTGKIAWRLLQEREREEAGKR
jgi:fatty-acyl-CoA synthase